jgi:ribosome-associated translation inhibitor RaiA
MSKTVTTYRDFESREHLSLFVEEQVQAAIGKFINRHDTLVEVTLNHDRGTARKQFSVGITLKEAHRAPIHVQREAGNLHSAVRDAVHTAEKILRRARMRALARRRHPRQLEKYSLAGESA